jgi:hypothetical protein
MLKWISVMVVAMVIMSLLRPYLVKIGLAKLPLDLEFRIGGKDIYLPIGSCVVFTGLAMLIGRFL